MRSLHVIFDLNYITFTEEKRVWTEQQVPQPLKYPRKLLPKAALEERIRRGVL